MKVLTHNPKLKPHLKVVVIFRNAGIQALTSNFFSWLHFLHYPTLLVLKARGNLANHIMLVY